jgi:nitrogen fixation NifU-like protein
MPFSEDLRELYQKVILDHSRSPRNQGQLSGDSCVHIHSDNPSCGDEIDLYIRFNEDGSISDIKFEGQGCAISQASASMMTEKVKGIPRQEVLQLIQDLQHTVLGNGEVSSSGKLGELQLLEGIQKFPQRIKCALLGWRGLEKALSSAKLTLQA